MNYDKNAKHERKYFPWKSLYDCPGGGAQQFSEYYILLRHYCGFVFLLAVTVFLIITIFVVMPKFVERNFVIHTKSLEGTSGILMRKKITCTTRVSRTVTKKKF